MLHAVLRCRYCVVGPTILCCITQSAVTKRLQRLESSLGATLLNDLSDLRAAVSDGRTALADVGVGVAHALGEFVLTEPIETIREEFPGLGLRLATGWSRDLLEHVRTGALDAAVVFCPKRIDYPRKCSQSLPVAASGAEGDRHGFSVHDLMGSSSFTGPGTPVFQVECAARGNAGEAPRNARL
jgi:DNA-binding transcriptional LysR family regulator